MTLNSTSDCSIFKDGKLKPGIYKIQNICSETFLDIHILSREVCCRPARDLGEGRGLVSQYPSSVLHVSDGEKWEIKRFGDGYTVQVFEPGRPERFCMPMMGDPLKKLALSVAAFPVAWRVEIVDDNEHRAFEFVRFYWGTTEVAWDLDGGRTANGNKVITWSDAEPVRVRRIWKLIPVSRSSSEAPDLGSLPPYGEDATVQFSTHAHHAESERDDFGTTVTEVTIVTTRKKYRVEDI